MAKFQNLEAPFKAPASKRQGRSLEFDSRVHPFGLGSQTRAFTAVSKTSGSPILPFPAVIYHCRQMCQSLVLMLLFMKTVELSFRHVFVQLYPFCPSQ